jgi:ParB-like chromosome segregation protein Spo0J
MLETTIKMVSLEFVRDLPVMELANEYPMITEDQETDLIASIEASGIREPLIIFRTILEDPLEDPFEDQLLDGRNRLSSAIKVELEEVPVRYFIGTVEEAEDLIIDLNEKRRHLLPVQRAYIADKHRAIVSRRAKDRMLATQKNDAAEDVRAAMHEPCIAEESQETGTTREILAKKHNAGINSIDTVQRIRRVSEETMKDPDQDGEVSTPRAIKASAVLTKMQKGTITITDAVKNVFGDPGQDINPDEQSKISTAKARLGKIVTDLLNDFDDYAHVLMDMGNEVDQEFVRAKLLRLNGFMATMNTKYAAGDTDVLLDPDDNRDFWSDVEARN